jgi:hypothetical protein
MQLLTQVRAGALIAGAALLVAACGDTKEAETTVTDTGTTETTPAEAPADTTTMEAAPPAGDGMAEGTLADPLTADPAAPAPADGGAATDATTTTTETTNPEGLGSPDLSRAAARQPFFFGGCPIEGETTADDAGRDHPQAE